MKRPMNILKTWKVEKRLQQTDISKSTALEYKLGATTTHILVALIISFYNESGSFYSLSSKKTFLIHVILAWLEQPQATWRQKGLLQKNLY